MVPDCFRLPLMAAAFFQGFCFVDIGAQKQ
jgi:hypothetical protein